MGEEAMTMPRWLLRIGWLGHKVLRRITGGHIGTARPGAGRVGTLFLHTTGRTSGQPRVNGLYFLDDGQNHIVVASNAGARSDPGWLLNLRAHPAAQVEIEGRLQAVWAREATDAERARLWLKLVAGHPPFAGYERTAGRSIPVVILEPRGTRQSA